MQKEKLKQNGITLIALVITIIVMLILVGVTVTVALKGGLFSTAKQAAGDTEIAVTEEQKLAEGQVETDGFLYNSMDDYLNGKPILTLPDGWSVANRPAGWSSKVVAIQDEEDNLIPLPTGYEISGEEGESTIAGGLVIKDTKQNEFVWIPVSTTFRTSYTDSGSLEPTELTADDSNTNEDYDSQTTLNYYYGMKTETTPFYSYPTTDAEKADANNDFAYIGHYNEMVASVNKYHGFYIGRYETTINANNEVGSKYNTTVLTADKSIPQTNNKSCLWWGLYYAQRNSNIEGNKESIQTNMIWGQQWNAMLSYFDSKSIDYSAFENFTRTNVVNSGQLTNNNGSKDKIYNIYDLRINGLDLTAEGDGSGYHYLRGGSITASVAPGFSASVRMGKTPNDTWKYDWMSTRLTLYIK